ncbi:MAG: UDP-N-acetylmuramate dehydrogenase [Bacillota bacterium]|uniref:UDP-N-acetylenolpyruvoylglucosamine reductase n=1 Tax=Thermanaerosceptrum fracticalcis TaxID=1712410 RepID=A0A7G6DZK1_THEFR|nr:UDP-N-acetylmuramate dehydrogenase [Thermanaerosceptrum fracticalcis]QNB45255.1 UDP-N-acetylmuramate dehydrogenase [Thermanaerosceptrum fracticalcis]
MDTGELYQKLKEAGHFEIRMNEPLSKHTTWRVGGPAEIMCLPESPEDCAVILRISSTYQIPVTLLGSGSNVLVSDRGLKGVVIKTKKLKTIVWDGMRVTAGAGVSLPFLSQEAYKKSLAGLEFAAGIPGTLGGAVIMNAGAHGSSLSQVVSRVTTLTEEGRFKIYAKDALKFNYRSSILKNKKELVVEVNLTLQPGDPGQMKNSMEKYLREREAKQPLHLPNAGSVFKNPPGDSAGRLIEAAGAKGWRVGDAQISEKHANFIVNLGKAKAADIIQLIEEVQRTVQEKFSITLETEVIFLGI